jgi:hypothetical protein
MNIWAERFFKMSLHLRVLRHRLRFARAVKNGVVNPN